MQILVGELYESFPLNRLVGHNDPAELIFELGEARIAYPAVVVLCCISDVECIRGFFDHKRRLAKLTVVVVPRRIVWIPAITATNEIHSEEICFLSVQSPVAH
jgi:hypothetical protein